jgi:hypothetical protein
MIRAAYNEFLEFLELQDFLSSLPPIDLTIKTHGTSYGGNIDTLLATSIVSVSSNQTQQGCSAGLGIQVNSKD